MKRPRLPFLIALISLISIGMTGSNHSLFRWAVYYAAEGSPEQFHDYRLVVFDADRHPALRPLVEGGTTVLAYLSLGEIEQQRAWFGQAQKMRILLGKNPTWPTSYYVDLRDPRWTEMVVRQLVPALLAQGFQGAFLDTLDDPVELERRDPEKCRGMTIAAGQLVKGIRRAYPSITLMMNRGYALLPDVGGHIDIALGESVYGTYDFERRVYLAVPAADYRAQVQLLKQAGKANPALRICTLDYWDPADRDGIRRIYREQRVNGFDPYVATIGLDGLVKEPH